MGGKADPHRAAVVVTVDALTSRISVLEAQVRSVTAELDVARQLYHLVGHEVRTPLTVVLGVLSTLDAADVPSDEQRRLLTRALEQARRLREVVDDLMAGDSPSRSILPRAALETVTLAPLLRAACAALPSRRVVFDVTEGLRIATEPTRLSAIVTNLADHAGSQAPGQVEVSARRASREVVITVTDHGPGLQGRDAEQIFEPFESVAPPPGGARRGRAGRLGRDERSNSEASPGVGLYLARLLARSLGGDVTLLDAPHGGLEATVHLPQRRSGDPAPALTPSRPSTVHRRPRAGARAR
jgi:signal transduction histidine kinase